MFKGIQKVSLIDYPGFIAATLFTGGCNFRCAWCHNWSLVEPALLSQAPDLSEESVQEFLISRKGKIQGICITGGEPTLWGEKLENFIRWAKKTGFLIKLDTNGYIPEVLKKWLDEKLLDFVAMDIKNVFPKYAETVGLKDIVSENILQSIEWIKKSGVPHQFRTTLVPPHVDREEMEAFAESTLGEAIVFQEYREQNSF